MNNLTGLKGRRRALEEPIAGLTERLTTWSFQALVFASVIAEFLGTTQIYSAGFYTFHIVDPPVVMMIAAIMLQFAGGQRIGDLITLSAVTIATLIIGNFVLGMAETPATALLAIRANGSIATSLLLAAVSKPTPAMFAAIRRALYAGTVVLGVLVILRFAVSPTIFMTIDVNAINVNDGGRPLSASGTMLLVISFALLASDAARHGTFNFRSSSVMAVVTGMLIAASGQGTATFAAAIIIVLTLVLESGPNLRARWVLAVLLCAPTLSIVLINFSDLASNATIAHRLDNLQTRKMVWEGLMGIWPKYPISTQLFGVPAGQDLHLYIFANGGYRPWYNSIHSMYYGSLPMMGYAGLGVFILLQTVVVIRTAPGLSSRMRFAGVPAYPFACCVASIVVSYSYELSGCSLFALIIPIIWLKLSRWSTSRPLRRHGIRLDVNEARPSSSFDSALVDGSQR